MNIDYPAPAQMPGLRALWKEAFGDEDAFLDQFYTLAYAPHRCRCVTMDSQVAAALYWFDVTCSGQKFAYLYAIATAAAHRGRGLCTALVEDTKAVLNAAGCHGALLVPENGGLARMYEKMGFTPCTTVSEFTCAAGPHAAALRKIDTAEFAARRRGMLPDGGVIQAGADLALLASQAAFFSGDGFLAAVTVDGGKLHCHELLGCTDQAPGIVRALGCTAGFFRTPGTDKPFAMVCPLRTGCQTPTYFGLALD